MSLINARFRAGPLARALMRPGRQARRTTAAVLATMLLGMTVAVAPVGAAPVPPVFTNGEAQPVFAPTAAGWVNYELWVEAPMDTDADGKLDRIHVDVSRVVETDTENLKVPAIIEASPYYAGTVNVVNWNVNHEIGFPPADREVRSPNIFNTSPTISTAFESFWVPRGFAVMHVEGTGTGKSTGCPSVGGPEETIGPKAVIDWLNGRAKGFTTVDGTTELTAYWHNGKSAMIGTSYNGTLPNAVASTGVDGLAAIVPISAISSWYDYYRANGMVRAPGGFQGEDLDVLGEYIYTRADQQICRQKAIYDLRLIQDRVTGNYSPDWHARDYMKDVDKVKAAVIVAHGNNDWNVMTKHAFRWYEALRARGVPHQLFYHTGGHGGAPPNGMLNRWFTRYLWDVQNGVENDPIARIVRPADTCPESARAVGDQPNVTNVTVDSSAKLAVGDTVTVQFLTATNALSTTSRTIVAIPDATHITLSAAVATGAGQRVGNGQIIYKCAMGFPSAYPEWPDPAMQVATMRFLPGAPGVGQLSLLNAQNVAESMIDNAPASQGNATELALMNAASSPNRLAYRTPPFSKDVRISGTAMVNMRVKFSAAKANVTAQLVAYPPTGNPFVVDRGWIDPENRSGDYSVTQPMTADTYYNLRFDMQGKDYIVAAGWRLGVVLMSSHGNYTVRPAPGLVMTVDLANSSIELPIVGGATHIAQAMGVTAPSISYTLNPPAPNGDNGWYRTNVSLDWTVNENGAATTTVGCADETFTTDSASITRSCTATNLLGTTGPVTVNLKRDATAPTVNVTGVTNGGVYILGTTPAAGCTTSDNLSGVAQAASLSITGGPLVGFFTATCANARDMAGNTTTVSATYQVVYDFSGFNPPVGDTTLGAQAGSAVPIKFELGGDQGTAVLAAGWPKFQQLNCATGAAIGAPTSTDATQPFSFTPDGQYVYVWKTKKSQDGMCGRLDFKFIDQTTHSISIRFE